MEFPIFQVPYLGNGMTIALDAVLHVIISHGLAIGAVSMVVVSEYLGQRRASHEWECFAKDFLRVIVFLTTSVGAITGVGIWLITSALAPRGIGSLLRVFFWPWFMEWGVFTAEVVIVLIYYYTWQSWTGERKKHHLRLGLGYVAAALCSALLITGILGFMLTPDGWPWNKSLWSAFFNASYLPQLVLRLGIAYSLGTLFSVGYLVFTRREGNFRKEGLAVFAKIALISLTVTLFSAAWYFKAVPSAFKTHSLYAVMTSRFSQQPGLFWEITIGGAVFLLLFWLVALRRSVISVRILVVPAIVVAILFVAQFERVREFIRGPYLMPGYMYANQVLLAEAPLFAKKGMLPSSYWYKATAKQGDPVGQGAYLFAQNCSACHTIGGINDIVVRVQGRTADGLYVILGHTQEMVPFMPPFSGTNQERRIMADFLFRLGDGTIKLGAPSRFTPLNGGSAHE
ncbi:MAG: c-type cytochrome [Desulfurivibrionaceae bacterium]|jgi:mono/diheme cytochrome c family protein